MGRQLLQHESGWLMGEIIPPAAAVPVQTVRHRVPPAGRREKCFKLPSMLPLLSSPFSHVFLPSLLYL